LVPAISASAATCELVQLPPPHSPLTSTLRPGFVSFPFLSPSPLEL
jgi:hypothetical protein